MSISLFGNKQNDDSTDVPAPGTPPTIDEHGVQTDPGNPWFGPVNPKVGYPTEGYSGEQRRRIRRAMERREAAEVRVNSAAYARNQRRYAKTRAFLDRRRQILDGTVSATPAALANAQSDTVRRGKITEAYDTLAQRREDAEDRRADRLDARRIARFKAGKPRGKDLRDDVMNQYSAFLPASYWNAK